MTIKCFILDLKDNADLIARYRAWHEPGQPPPAVTRGIRAAGIKDMQIFLSGNRLCMVVDADATFSTEQRRQAEIADPEIAAWERLMSDFQEPVPWAAPGEKWVEATRIYALADQPA